MCWRLFIFGLSFIVINGDLSKKTRLIVDLNPRQKVDSRNSRGVVYANADTFFKNSFDPALYHRPLQKIHLNLPFYGAAITASTQRVYQLKGDIHPLPYMLPVSNEIASHVTDPIYQNKVHGSTSSLRGDADLSDVCAGRTGQLPSASSCRSYVNCWEGGVAAEQECPGGLLFSASAGYCDYPHRVACGQRPITSKRADCSEEYSVSRDAGCSGFAVCVGGRRVRFACPAGLHYSDRLGVCDYPYRVRCQVSDEGSAAHAPAPLQSGPEPPPGASAPLVLPEEHEAESLPGDVAALDGHEYAPPLGQHISHAVRMSPYVASSQQDALWQIEGARQRPDRLIVPPYFSQF